MLLFALANAGVSLEIACPGHPVSMGIIVGLVLGRTARCYSVFLLAVNSKAALLPKGVRWDQLGAVACLGGIGFTMSLFIASLTFGNSLELDIAKLGIFLASICAAVIGATAIIYLKPSKV